MAGAILIVEDEVTLAKNLKIYLLRHGFDVQIAASGEQALEEFDAYKPDAMLLDFNLPQMSGLEVLAKVRQKDPHIKVLMITGHGNEQIAVDAMKAGAYDYLTKPVELGKIKLVLDKALGEEKLEGALAYYQKKTADEADSMLGDSAPMLALKDKIQQLLQAEFQLSDGNSPAVLITGETGTGKELVARALHFEGPRREKPFIELNCASIPTQLLESELFGYERGAFTDARQRKLGLAEAADGGTLFLDEIGDLDFSIQAKLLKLLEDKSVRRLGSVRDQPVNVRILAATNKDLEILVREGKFRSDLFFRLRIIHLHLPTLHDRGDDAFKLARHFLDKHGARYGKRVRFDQSAVEAIRNYTWPGNVRELRNAMEQVVLMARDDIVTAEQLPITHRLHTAASAEAPTASVAMAASNAPKSLEEVEREMLVNALVRSTWNVTRAAKMLGVSRDTLRYRIEKYHLRHPNQGMAGEA
jgi:two-component system, NtrC family, response regulator AtoC